MAEYQFSRVPKIVPNVETRFRTIKTAIPAPGTEELLNKLEEVESRSMQGQPPIVWNKAWDFNIADQSGNKWIDFSSTIFVANVGHSNPRVVAAVKSALESELIHTYAYANPFRIDYLKALLEFSPPHLEKAFLLSAGTEATEAALKLMRMNGQRLRKRRLGIICFEGNWHGRTMGAQLMGGNSSQKEWIGFRDPDIHHIPFPYPWVLGEQTEESFLHSALEVLVQQGLDLENDICGIMLETFQGWGALFYPKTYVQAVADVCKRHNILLCFDEMQAGFGRTGKRFGYEHYDVSPDLICCGKGMGGGFPLSGVIGRQEVMDLPKVGDMSSTHSANPIVCAAGLATLHEIQSKNLVAESERKGIILLSRLRHIASCFPDEVTGAYGRGLIAALIFRENRFPSKVVERAIEKGLLPVHTGRNSIKLGPPLTIVDEALLEGLDVLEESIREVREEWKP